MLTILGSIAICLLVLLALIWAGVIIMWDKIVIAALVFAAVALIWKWDSENTN